MNEHKDEGLKTLLRQIIELERVARHSPPDPTLTRWCWVLSPHAVDLLRKHARTQNSLTVDLDDQFQLRRLFGMPVRLDEDIPEPRLELRLSELFPREAAA